MLRCNRTNIIAVPLKVSIHPSTLLISRRDDVSFWPLMSYSNIIPVPTLKYLTLKWMSEADLSHARFLTYVHATPSTIHASTRKWQMMYHDVSHWNECQKQISPTQDSWRMYMLPPARYTHQRENGKWCIVWRCIKVCNMLNINPLCQSNW
jgi:hypothetical protein